MERAARRPIPTVAALATVGALALSPLTLAPTDVHAGGATPLRVSTQEVQLTDAWFDLLNDTLVSTYLLGQLAVGANPVYPLPNPVFVAPILTQLLVVNPLTYAVQLLTGEGAEVPTEIITHINNLVLVAQAIGKDVPPAIVKEIQAPFQALQLAFDSITTSTNLLLGLFEAPAVFLNAALNSQYGLIGVNGPIALGFIIRNVVAQQLFTPPPSVLPFKKAGGAAALRTQASAITAAPSGTASSARSKPKAPSSAASSKRKPATSAKADKPSGGQGHSKRG
ncbi:hypothetical protein [Mycolicibacterium vinylchloridicum]|uniref:hypothetical protein n=1 Tax=Mycolicibacterium vinylchloridicum TaxID=2736928 RepID=UPI0015CD2D4B|nr:hypothetical protein [Mycolicibacterium vinylchloridicum]